MVVVVEKQDAPIAQDAHAKQDAVKPYPNLKYHYDLIIEAMNSIFVLKPILDLIYEDAKKDKEEIESLKKRIKELEGLIKGQPTSLANPVQNPVPSSVQNPVQESEIDDSQYASEASLPATSAPVSAKNEVEDETKTVKMINNMSKKEYMKEYQKNYRKKQKESKEIVMNV